MQIIKAKNYEEMSRLACSLLVEHVQQTESPVIGLATGSTPEGLYKCLVKEFREGRVSFRAVSTFNLDEYAGLSMEDANSYQWYMTDKLFAHVDVPARQIHLPDGMSQDFEQECLNYERQIQEAGNIDIQVLGLGLNGHIGFNEPGTSFLSRTHVVDLDESTREANARFFPSIDEVPTQAISMGIASIMESKKILLLVSGKEKAEALYQAMNSPVSEEFPATILQLHPEVTVIADELALSKVLESYGEDAIAHELQVK
ncbi:glucosamine-6-phosphate deaminase [Microbacterium sp. APC 3898]|uniref:Glucosamine-6-phosphate deaminase n=1 Tax=Planococcus notacanthi TaxID=3035188 RepID=A0ABT7ZEY7_9BACL|nr:MULTISPECIES: glucosamine-6-phosphate deaminase [Terrabacteria group]MDN3425723.1 glucosamine-6-phosphate deaminase [Planococcus sp. APC 4016]MDN3500729.1 glucosamine-6-phosphate deaminase [Microbacterium sp. APC 3898]